MTVVGGQQIVRVTSSDLPAPPPAFPRLEARRVDRPRAPMVAWYRPVELARTGVSVATSTVFGRYADQRLVEARIGDPAEYFDYSVVDGAPRNELWLDYVADSGDGFDSTYAVASAVARDKLELTDPAGASHLTRRGRVLVFGGDLSYPIASRDQYEQRLVMPYEHALPYSNAPHPDLFSIPGNHDWYDSLVAFTRRFCSKRWFAGWRTNQRLSYFALHLPHDWWLLGTDIQLDSDIDSDQVAYFKSIAGLMTERSRIILCNAEPQWIYEGKFAQQGLEYSDTNLQYLQDRVFKRNISVFLAGDLHHYRRHSDTKSRHKIVAGGGGAYLHPTHDHVAAELPGATADASYTLQQAYPDVATSRKLVKRNFLFPFLNPQFGLVTGLFYLLICRAMQVDLSHFGLGEIDRAAHAVLCATLRGPNTLLWVTVVIATGILFTERNPRWYRYVGGLGHAMGHLVSIFFVGWGASWLVGQWDLGTVASLLAMGALMFVGGWIAGSLVMGGYLYVSLNVFGRHSNEAFSSLAIPDWKNFLRLHIDDRGTLRIYPIGIDRVPRRWKSETNPHGPRLISDDPRSTPPRLIEPPIVIER